MKAIFFCMVIMVLLLGGCDSENVAENISENVVDVSENVAKPAKLKIVATVTPHAEILEYIQQDLKEKGVEIEIIDAPDYNMPNRALADKEADANFFQHVPYLTQQINDFGYEIESLVGIHIEPMGFYSKKISSLSELRDGAVISVPNDPSNEARALVILHNNGIIQLDDPKNPQATKINIASNPKNIKIEEIDAAMLSRTLDDVDGSVINSNYAMEATPRLVPTKDAIVIESAQDNPYVNLVAIRKGDAEKPEFKILKEVMTSDKVRQFLLDKYDGAVVPAF